MATTVTVKQGILRGVEGKSVKGDKFLKFLGIPYARPPVGELRFKAPVPADPWTGERDATKEGGSCLCFDQMTRQITGSEDCLYLNVFTKNPDSSSDLKPVMVWIHGGGFTSGSSSSSIYGPEVLMSKDVVLVSINYRIGIFGFLSLEDTTLEVPGNAGMKDQVLALKWVQENIRNFGGDPKNVTIFGESAGGVAVHLLCLSPLAKGLFHRAIAMSGSYLNPWTWGTRSAKAVAKVMGKDVQTEKEALKVLQGATAEEVNEAQLKLPDHLWDSATLRPFCPIVERPNPTAFLAREPSDIVASGEYNQTPFMTGFANREGLLLEAFKMQGLKLELDKLEDFVPLDLGVKKGSEESKRVEAKLSEQYMLKETDGIIELASDTMFVRGIVDGIEKQVKTSTQPIYMYQISAETKLALLKKLLKVEKPGVSHGDEVGLLFNVALFERDCKKGSIEEKSSDRLVTLFTNFAKYGNPTPSEEELGVTWAPVEDPANLNYLDIGEELALKVGPFPERMAFWKQLKLNSKLNRL